MNETPDLPNDANQNHPTPAPGDPAASQAADPASTVDRIRPSPNPPEANSIGDMAKQLVDEVRLANSLADEQRVQVQRDLIDGFKPGEVLAKRFEILQELGRGGMAVIYQVIDCKLHKTVAVKVAFWAEVDWSGMKRLVEEAQTTAPLDSKHIILVYDYGEESGFAWFAMEYLEGGTLAKLLREKGSLPESQAFAICREVLQGLQTIHSRGLMHGDIKPDNVLATANRETWKIADLGIARYLSPLSGTALDELVSGTCRYLAPECWGASRPGGAHGAEYSPRADTYAVGAMLFEMLTGSRPFADVKREFDCYQAHRDRKLADGPAEQRALSKKARAIVERATDHDPLNRYRDAGEFLSALTETRAQPPGPRRLALVACLVSALLGIAAISAALWDKKTARPEYVGEFDIKVTDRDGKSFLRDEWFPIEEAIPLRKGNKLVVVAKLRQTPVASNYLILINTTGKSTLIEPSDWQWTKSSFADGAWHALRWPGPAELPFEVPQAPAGLGAILWLVRERPFSKGERQELDNLIAEISWKRHPEQVKLKKVIWWDNGPRDLTRGAPNETASGEANDPIRMTEKMLLSIKDRALAQYFQACCYPVAGE